MNEATSSLTCGACSRQELPSGVPWIESARSRSRSVTGLPSVLLVFKRGNGVLNARQMVRERLAPAYALPNVATPPVILQPMSATGRVMMVSLSSEPVEPTELSLLARRTIKPKLVGCQTCSTCRCEASGCASRLST